MRSISSGNNLFRECNRHGLYTRIPSQIHAHKHTHPRLNLPYSVSVVGRLRKNHRSNLRPFFKRSQEEKNIFQQMDI